MSYAEFVKLAKATRDAQRTYFRTRTSQALEESKRLERELDDAIDRETNPQTDFMAQLGDF